MTVVKIKKAKSTKKCVIKSELIFENYLFRRHSTWK